MTAVVLDVLSHLATTAFLVGCLLWSIAVLTRAVQENHARGRARIHNAGPSWSPRTPRQETRS